MKTPWYLNSWLVCTIVSLFAFSLVGPSLVSAQQQDGARKKLAALESYQIERENLATLLYQAKKQRDTIDETDFNPQARAHAIGSHIEDVFAFVRDEIAFQPYQGILRLAEGTLMSRAGNACDQSLLLGTLLRTHGYSVRYAHGTLSETQARTLLDHVDQPSPLKTRPKQEARFGRFQGATQEITQGKQALLKAAIDTFHSDLWANTTEDVGLLTESLTSAGQSIETMSGTAVETWLSDVQGHCWVQVESNGNWIDLDPSFPQQKPGHRVTAVKKVLQSFSTQEFAHKLKFVIAIEQDKGSQREKRIVLDQVAGLTEAINEIRVATMPEISRGSPTKAFSDPAFLKSFDIIWPFIQVNGHTFKGDPFNFEGDLVPTDPRVRQAQKVQKSVGGGFGALGGALSGLTGDGKASNVEAPQLTRVWLTLTLIHPDGTERSIERDLVRRLVGKGVSKPEAERDLRRQLLSDLVMMASGSRIANSYVPTKYLDHQLANRTAYFAALALEHGRTPPNLVEILDKRMHSYPFHLLEFFYTRSTVIHGHLAQHFSGLSAFPAEPQVVAFRQGVTFHPQTDPVLEQHLDIMFNALRTIETPALLSLHNRGPLFHLRQGVLDTNIEYLLMGGGESVNAHSVITRASEQGIDLVMIPPDKSDMLANLTVNQETRSALQRDLEQGFAILAPVMPVPIDGTRSFAWWRIHFERGETLGMGGLGEGQAFSEYLYSALTSLIASTALCGLFQIPSVYRTGSIDTGGYVKCVIIGGVSGGVAPAFGSGLGGMTLFNLVACQFSLALNQLDVRLGGARGYGIDPRSERSKNWGGQLAKDFLLCFVIGMAASGASYGVRSYGAKKGWWPKPGEAGKEAVRGAGRGTRGQASGGRPHTGRSSTPSSPTTGSRPTTGSPSTPSGGTTGGRSPSTSTPPSSSGGISPGGARPGGTPPSTSPGGSRPSGPPLPTPTPPPGPPPPLPTVPSGPPLPKPVPPPGAPPPLPPKPPGPPMAPPPPPTPEGIAVPPAPLAPPNRPPVEFPVAPPSSTPPPPAPPPAPAPGGKGIP